MGVHIDWDDETKTSIRLSLEGRWTWDELERAVCECIALAKLVDYRVNVIADFARSGPMPLGVIPRSRKLLVQLMPYLNLLFVVNGDAFVNLMATVFQKVYPNFDAIIHISPSLQQARHLIRRQSDVAVT